MIEANLLLTDLRRELALLVDDPEVAAAVDASGAHRIGYRPLRDAMRHPVRP